LRFDAAQILQKRSRRKIMPKLKKSLQIVFIFATALLFSGDTSAQTRGEQAIKREAERISRDEFSFSTTTPKGARIYAVRKPSAKMLAAIDRGLTDLFAVARKNDYRKRLNYSDYVIFIARADRTKNADGNYSPDIAVPTGQYAGSIYDQGGFIYAAGMVVGYNPLAFMIAEHDGNLRRVSDVVRYEGEHLVLFHNDRRRYNETADHSRGGGHPILQ
jgi:hypothetical protein